jgi:putative oxidoreductase
MQKYLRLEFIPSSADLGLLVLRFLLGGSMLWIHGLDKFMSLLHGSTKFLNPIGLGEAPSLVLAAFAECVCTVLLVLGLFTRLAAFILVVNMAVAFFVVNSASAKGNVNGELAWLYLVGYLALLFAGAGKFSLDRK